MRPNGNRQRNIEIRYAGIVRDEVVNLCRKLDVAPEAEQPAIADQLVAKAIEHRDRLAAAMQLPATTKP